MIAELIFAALAVGWVVLVIKFPPDTPHDPVAEAYMWHLIAKARDK
jgi:hypothetical protein